MLIAAFSYFFYFTNSQKCHISDFDVVTFFSDFSKIIGEMQFVLIYVDPFFVKCKQQCIKYTDTGSCDVT